MSADFAEPKLNPKMMAEMLKGRDFKTQDEVRTWLHNFGFTEKPESDRQGHQMIGQAVMFKGEDGKYFTVHVLYTDQFGHAFTLSETPKESMDHLLAQDEAQLRFMRLHISNALRATLGKDKK